jgi:recombination protein RecT
MSAVMTKTPLRQVSSVQELLFNEQARIQISMVASRTLTPERLMRVTANAIRRTPALQKCDPMSFLGAMMFLAQMSLEPNTPLGHAYLLPFNKNIKVGKDEKTGRDIWKKVPQVEVVIGYKGFKELSRRSGQIKSMHGDIVYEGDLFTHEYGSGQHLKHVPCGRKDKPVGAYFHVAYNGGEGHVYMTKDEIEAHRDLYSKGWQNAVKDGKTAESPWKKDWEAMWVKTPCRILIGRGDIPMSTELSDALAVDEAVIDFRSFAADPMQLPDVIEADADEVEEEAKPKAGTRTDVKYVDEAESQDQAGEQSQVAETANHSEPEQGSLLPVDDKPAAQDVNEPDWSQNGFGKGFLMDVRDIGFDAAMDLHGGEIERIKDEKPGLHAYLMAESSKLTNA